MQAWGYCLINIILLLILYSLQFHSEVSHQLCLPDDADAMADGVATVVYVLEGCGNHVHVVVGVYAAGDAQT